MWIKEKVWTRNVKFFWKIRREQSQNTHRRCNALGENPPYVVCISSPRAMYTWLSVNLTDGDGHCACGGGAVSWTFRRELKAECSRRRGSSPWASASQRARPCALGEERIHWELELWLLVKLLTLGRERIHRELELWFSAKLLTHGEDSVSGSVQVCGGAGTHEAGGIRAAPREAPHLQGHTPTGWVVLSGRSEEDLTRPSTGTGLIRHGQRLNMEMKCFCELLDILL
jgi:hypothetical protein